MGLLVFFNYLSIAETWQYLILAVTDPIVKKFHENLCKKITTDGGDYHVILFGDHAWGACRDWFMQEKILNVTAIPHGSYIKNNYHYQWQRDAFASTMDLGAAFLSGTAPSPIDDDTMNKLLHVGRQKKFLVLAPVRAASEQGLRHRRRRRQRSRRQRRRGRRRRQRSRRRRR